ncbi:MAG TPA: hypothetical protein VHD56_15760 [Tepidisphaeraceae bacterium]|nr:hypothetical protein [Tepidisphaeraceae bacterium]
MNKPARKFLVIALVASALCADQAVAAPMVRQQSSASTGGLVTRLSVSLRRTVPAVRVVETRRLDQVESIVPSQVDYRTSPCVRSILLASQFPLPPPAL